MRTATVLALVLACSTATAAPAPDTPARVQEKLDALKERAPEVLKRWAEQVGIQDRPEFRRVRRTGDREAKLTFVFRTEDSQGRPNKLQPVTIYLHFYAGVWSAARFEAYWMHHPEHWNRLTHLLMDDLDEAAEK